MKDRLLDFIDSELEKLKNIEPSVPDTIGEDEWWDGEDCYTDGYNDGRYSAYMTIKKMIEE